MTRVEWACSSSWPGAAFGEFLGENQGPVPDGVMMMMIIIMILLTCKAFQVNTPRGRDGGGQGSQKQQIAKPAHGKER